MIGGMNFGATIHVCNDKNLFKHYEIVAEGQKVLMGNTSTTTILEKGSVEVHFTSGKRLLLTNVHHVPEIHKNLVSTALLCKKGLKAVIESDKLIFTKSEHDPKDFNKAMSSRDVAFWKEAINDEMDSLLVELAMSRARAELDHFGWLALELELDYIFQGPSSSRSQPWSVRLRTKMGERERRAVAQLEYASAIGSLMYAMHYTRPDIAYTEATMSRAPSKLYNGKPRPIGRRQA
ncbi:UNVERIFIED_CONTAM: hypothetical protein Scaly_2438600 [Sesamum calycinum]|uniref:Retrovirus-related Pol polyprotein from transposon TNT 1-94-like beta-barrel domain-containing protein n=1 Tax=Sesamum calycinum TaxID=2727403 RepID=A0AAW2M2K3_9LAMI